MVIFSKWLNLLKIIQLRIRIHHEWFLYLVGSIDFCLYQIIINLIILVIYVIIRLIVSSTLQPVHTPKLLVPGPAAIAVLKLLVVPLLNFHIMPKVFLIIVIKRWLINIVNWRKVLKLVLFDLLKILVNICTLGVYVFHVFLLHLGQILNYQILHIFDGLWYIFTERSIRDHEGRLHLPSLYGGATGRLPRARVSMLESPVRPRLRVGKIINLFVQKLILILNSLWLSYFHFRMLRFPF